MQIIPRMCATVQNCLRRRVILATVKFCEFAMEQNVSVHTDKRSAGYIDGFLDQMKRVSK